MYWESDDRKLIGPELTNDNVKVEDVLNEESCFEEYISRNKHLCDFLAKNYKELIGVLINHAYDEDIPEDRLKVAYLVSEILAYDSPTFNSLFVENDEFFKALWAIFNIEPSERDSSKSFDKSKRRQLNPLIASFFLRLYTALFNRHTDKMLKYLCELKEPNDFVSCILNNLNSSAILDLVSISWEYLLNHVDRNFENAVQFHKMLDDNEFIDRAMICFIDPEQEYMQQFVQQLIIRFITVSRETLFFHSDSNLIIQKLEQEKFSETLIEAILSAKTSNSFKCGLRILQALMRKGLRNEPYLLSNNTMNGPEGFPDDKVLESKFRFDSEYLSSEEYILPEVAPKSSEPLHPFFAHLSRVANAVSKAFCKRVPDFIALLDDESYSRPLKLTTGELPVPFGQVRMDVVHLLVGLFSFSDREFLRKFRECNGLNILTKKFFEYPFNSKLHHHYFHIVCFIFRNITYIEYEYRNAQLCFLNDPDNKEVEARFKYLSEWLEEICDIQEELVLETGLLSRITDIFEKEPVPKLTPEMAKQFAELAKAETVAPTDVSDKKSVPIPDSPFQEPSLGKPEEASQPLTEAVDPEATAVQPAAEVQTLGSAQNSNKSQTETSSRVEEEIADGTADIEPLSMDITASDIKNEPFANFRPSNQIRPSYMGHLLQIAYLISDSFKSPKVKEALARQAEFRLVLCDKITKLNRLYESAKLSNLGYFKGKSIMELLEEEKSKSFQSDGPNISDIPPQMQLPGYKSHPLDDFDFDDIPDEPTNLEDFEKVFNDRRSSLFDGVVDGDYNDKEITFEEGLMNINSGDLFSSMDSVSQVAPLSDDPWKNSESVPQASDEWSAFFPVDSQALEENKQPSASNAPLSDSKSEDRPIDISISSGESSDKAPFETMMSDETQGHSESKSAPSPSKRSDENPEPAEETTPKSFNLTESSV